MTKFQRFVSYLALGTSIYGAYFLISGCFNLKNGTLYGQGAVALLAPVLIATPITILCLLIFIILPEGQDRTLKKSSQVFGMETSLVWGAILLLNVYFFVGQTCSWDW